MKFRTKVIRSLKNSILVVGSMLLFNSAMTSDPQVNILKSQVDFYQQEISCLEHNLSEMRDTLCGYQEFLSDPLNLAIMYTQDEQTFQLLAEQSRSIPYTKLFFAPGKRIKVKFRAAVVCSSN
jgi:hypothetical protein